jgi:hypothetical protein
MAGLAEKRVDCASIAAKRHLGAVAPKLDFKEQSLFRATTEQRAVYDLMFASSTPVPGVPARLFLRWDNVERLVRHETLTAGLHHKVIQTISPALLAIPCKA